MKATRQTIWSATAIAAVLLACPGMAGAQDLGRLLPEVAGGTGSRVEVPAGAATQGAGAGDETVLVEELRGVELGGALTVTDLQALRESLDARTGGALTVGGLLEMMDAVVAHYEARGFPVVEVLLPEQEVTDGWLRLEVVEGRVGDVALAGGGRLNAQRITRRLGLASGDRLTMAGLQGELDWLNRNQFYDARLVVAPGEREAEADLLFQLSDDRPLRVFGGFDNFGVEVVGEERWSAGFEWGDAFALGHRLLYQATVGADIEAFRAHALDYRVPLAWQHELGLLAAIVDSQTLLDDGVATGGRSWLLGAQYSVPLRRRGDWRHEISAGFDFKSTDNNLEFGGVEVFEASAELAQVVGRYQAALERAGRRTALEGEAVYSPGELSGANSDAAFAGIRAGAVSEYAYLRGQLRHVRRLPADASLVLRAGGQWADAPLLPSEQLALGGYDRVRGYPERDGLGDKGYWGSVELRAPVLGEGLQVLGFLDYGHSQVEGGGDGRELISGGPGVRYRLGGHASLSFDYGWQLDGGGSRGHVGLQLEF